LEWLNDNLYTADMSEVAWEQLEGIPPDEIRSQGILSIANVANALTADQIILSVPVLNGNSFPQDNTRITSTATEQGFMLDLINDIVAPSVGGESAV